MVAEMRFKPRMCVKKGCQMPSLMESAVVIFKWVMVDRIVFAMLSCVYFRKKIALVLRTG